MALLEACLAPWTSSLFENEVPPEGFGDFLKNEDRVEEDD
jgi:hypothetical protein